VGRWRDWFGHYTVVRPTREGAAYLALLVGVLFGAVNTGNNLVYMVLGVLLGMLVVANVIAEWNLRGLRVERRVPTEAFAGIPGTGALVLHNPRRRGAAYAIDIEALDGGRERAHVESCAPGGCVEVAANFTFLRRGMVPVARLRVASSFPFGLVHRWRLLDIPAEVLVYPEPLSRPVPPAPSGEGDEVAARGPVGWTGEFAGLRPWRPGDPLRRVHWPSSARAGQPLVAVRSAEGVEELCLRLDPALRGEAREEAIRRLAGRAEAHFARGDAVGLEADGERLEPRTGATWRRRCLTLLALLESR